MTKIKLLLIFLLINASLNGQNKTEMALYNIGLGSFTGGLGAIINKRPNEKTGKVFLKGFAQGGLGGYFVYESKNFMLKVSENKKLEYAWGAKIINSMGISIIENASSNNDFWEKWHMNIGFNRIELQIKDKVKLKYRVMPVSLILTGIFAYGNKFELQKSLKTGEIIFSVPDNIEYSGATWGKLILITESNLNNYNTISHEIIHSNQYDDFNFVNTFLSKPISKFSNKSILGKKLNNIFYFDFQAPVLGGLYLFENQNRTYYYDNFFEYEAGFFSNSLNLETP